MFYAKVREDELLGPIFNNAITDWPAHLERLTDFWEGTLKYTKAYYGNPLEVHQKVDAANNHSIEAIHFGIWLNLWVQTIDANFTGPLANKAKMSARKMASHIHIHLFQARNSSANTPE